MLQNCELDVRDKHDAQIIDDAAQQLSVEGCRTHFYPGIETVDGTLVALHENKLLDYQE